MKRAILIPLVVVGALALIATGAIAGVLIADKGDDSSPGPAQTNTGPARGSLGMAVAFNSQTGLRVTAVEADGPAAKAGIQVGDTVRSMDGAIVRTPEQLRAAAEAKKPGERVTITYERNDRELRAEVVLGDANASAAANPTRTPVPSNTPVPGQPNIPAQSRGGRLGVTVQQITPQLQQRLNLTRDSGVVVTEVMPDSPAAAAGVQRGDVILAIGATSVGTVQELQRAVLAAPVNQPVEISIQRGNDQIMLSQTLPPQANLDGLGNLIPEELRQRLQELIDGGAITAERLQQLLRLYQTRGDAIRVGNVESVNPGIVGGTFIITMTPLSGGSSVTVQTNQQTSIVRGTTSIQPGQLERGELLLVISMDNGQTAFQVLSLGQVRLR